MNDEKMFKKINISKIPTIYLVLILLIVSFIFRFMLINGGFFHMDTIGNAEVIENSIKDGKLYPTSGGRYGFVAINVFLYVLIKAITGITSFEFLLNFNSVLFGTFGVLIFYFLMRELFKNYKQNKRLTRLAFFGALVFSFFPPFLSMSTTIMTHSFSAFFILLAAFFLVKGLNNFNDKSSNKILFLAGLFLGVSLSVRETNIFFIIPFVFIYLFYDGELKKLKIRKERFKFKKLCFTFLPIIILGFIIFYLSFSYYLLHGAEVNKWGFIPKVFFSGLADIYNSFSLMGIILLAYGFYFIIREKRYLLLSFALVWFFSYYAYLGFLNTYSLRFLIIALIPFVIITTLAIDKFARISELLAIALVIILILFMFCPLYPVLKYRHDHSGLKEFALFVKNNTPEESYVFAIDEGGHIRYYAKRNVLGYPYKDIEKQKDKVLDNTKELLNKNKSVYLITSVIYYDKELEFYRILNSTFNISKVGTVLTEDFHHKSIYSGIRNETLMKVELW